MARKSSKTSHVLNLLSGDTGGEDKGTQSSTSALPPALPMGEVTIVTQSATIQSATEVQGSPHKPEIVPIPPSVSGTVSVVDASDTQHDPVSQLIHDSLLMESSTLLNEAPEPESTPPSQEIPVPDSIPEHNTEQTPDLPSDASPDPDISEELPEPPSQEEAKPEPEEKKYEYINVMEYIVSNKVTDYMKQFDMCTCHRCVEDTKALTLTNLTSKYIVTSISSVSPLLNFYSNKFLGAVTVELTKACVTIKENPKH